MGIGHWSKITLRSLLLFLLLSASSNGVAAETAPSWVKVPGTYEPSGSRDGTPAPGDFWYVDDTSVINIRGVLNVTVADSEDLQSHVATSCNPRHPRYQQLRFVTVETNYDFGWLSVNDKDTYKKVFKFICSRYGKVQHGQGYQRP
jgi:hypothetical protein